MQQRKLYTYAYVSPTNTEEYEYIDMLPYRTPEELLKEGTKLMSKKTKLPRIYFLASPLEYYSNQGQE